MKLYDIKKGSKIYEEASDGSKYLIFDHLDGAYSYIETEKGGIVHLHGTTPLVEFEDGYKIADEWVMDRETFKKLFEEELQNLCGKYLNQDITGYRALQVIDLVFDRLGE